MKSHRRSSSMIQFPSERPQPSRPSRTNQLAMHELRSKADELERLFAARNLRFPSHRKSSARGGRGGGRPLDCAPEVIDEILLRSFGKRVGGLAEFDGDLVLNKVHNPRYNMKQSPSRNSRGRFYERYMQLRDAKLREKWGSAEWVRKKKSMKSMEDVLEKTWATMKVQSGDSADWKKSFLQRGPFHVGSPTRFRDQVQSEEHKSLGGTDTDDSATGKFLSNKSKSSSTSQNSAHSSLTKGRTQIGYGLMQMAGKSSDPRKENMKPLERVRNLTGHSNARAFSRSKSTLGRIDVFKEEKLPRFRHKRNSSVTFGELKELSQLNSDSFSPALSRFTKDQSDDNISIQNQVKGEHKSFLRRGGGIGPGVGASISKLRASEVSESWNKRDDDEDLVKQQEYPLDMVGSTDEELERIWGKCMAIVPTEVNSEEEQSSQEIGNSKSFDVIDCAAEDDFHCSFTSNIHPSFSSQHDVLLGSPRANPDTSNNNHLDRMQGTDATRARKKWGSVKKPIFVTKDVDQPFKDVAKAFKKLLKFGSKSKNAKRSINDLLSTSASSEGGDDTEDGSYQGKQSLNQLTNSRKVYLRSSSIALNNGSMFPEQEPGSLLSFRSFNGRGAEVKA
ncbi:hypothetical protein Cni_G28631 [Canna indica]|uniref:Uncharacterized protein n=1 Tax=Canna indica TaxID=4628 RepID=A0AAQ3QQG3_9LILI|nr:hypothetical protein Cni_G28631 [Canna indica]